MQRHCALEGTFDRCVGSGIAVHGKQSEEFGGVRRNRTDDLFNAIEALYQLSYDPKIINK